MKLCTQPCNQDTTILPQTCIVLHPLINLKGESWYSPLQDLLCGYCAHATWHCDGQVIIKKKFIVPTFLYFSSGQIWPRIRTSWHFHGTRLSLLSTASMLIPRLFENLLLNVIEESINFFHLETFDSTFWDMYKSSLVWCGIVKERLWPSA